MYSRSRASKHLCSQKSVFRNEISTEAYFYEPHLLAVKISESFILSIQFYAGSKFCVINTISPPQGGSLTCCFDEKNILILFP